MPSVFLRGHRQSGFDRSAVQGAASDAARAQSQANAILDLHLIERAAAGENVHGGEAVFRPGVNGDVRLGDDDDAADAVRAEVVKDFGDYGPVPRPDGVEHDRPKPLGVLEQRGIAVVEFEERVEGEGRRH